MLGGSEGDTSGIEGRGVIATKPTFRYDATGDILYVDKWKPWTEQESETLEDEIVVRLNPNIVEMETVALRRLLA